MKFALISYQKLKGDKYLNFIFETHKDVQGYFVASSDISAHQFLDVWCELKGGQSWPHYVNQRVHQASVSGAMTMISMKAEETGEVSLVEACEIHDKLLYGKLKSMINLISNGEMIRVSSKGGYSTFDDMYQTHEELECDERQMREYLIAKDGMKFELALSKPIIIIENQSILSDDLIKTFRELKLSHEDYEIVLNFKYRTGNWKSEEFVKFFDDAVKNGLHTIIAETTLYDNVQFETLKKILTKVMLDNPDKSLDVKILTMETDKLIQHSGNLPSNLKLTLL